MRPIPTLTGRSAFASSTGSSQGLLLLIGLVIAGWSWRWGVGAASASCARSDSPSSV